MSTNLGPGELRGEDGNLIGTVEALRIEFFGSPFDRDESSAADGQREVQQRPAGFIPWWTPTPADSRPSEAAECLASGCWYAREGYAACMNHGGGPVCILASSVTGP